MPLVAAGQNALLTGGLSNVVTHAALHTANPGSSGTNEVTGGSPAYARKAITWAAASAGTQANGTTALTFDVPAGTTVQFLGLWGALTTGTFYGYAGIGTTLKYGVATTDATADTVLSKGHGLVNTDRVFLIDAAETLPAGLSEGTVYYVVGSATDTFQLSLTSGGAAVDITAGAEVIWFQTKPETFGSQGTLTVAIGALVLDATAYGTV